MDLLLLLHAELHAAMSFCIISQLPLYNASVPANPAICLFLSYKAILTLIHHKQYSFLSTVCVVGNLLENGDEVHNSQQRIEIALLLSIMF